LLAKFYYLLIVDFEESRHESVGVFDNGEPFGKRVFLAAGFWQLVER
jgi:hypothetical protein